MSAAPVVIVGAGPAGLSCAESYREQGGADPVIVIGDDPHPPYSRPALSKELLRGETTPREITLRRPSQLEALGIELRTGARAVSADAGARQIALERGSPVEFGSLVLATGSAPNVPELAGVDRPAVRTLRRVEDALALRDAARGAHVLVVGSGFIGCEAAASLAGHASRVTVCAAEHAPLHSQLGDEVAATVATWLECLGVELRPDSELQGIEQGRGRGVRAVFDGHTVDADVVLLALGITRCVELATALGVEGVEDAVPTDSRMRTNADGVYAVGDVAQAHNAAAGRAVRTQHWGDALEHGRVAGAVLAGQTATEWCAAPGFWSTIGDRTLKQVAWGDGYDHVGVTPHDHGGFTGRYSRRGVLVGVLAHRADEDYDRGRELVENGAPWP